MRIDNITRTETYVQLDSDGWRMLTPTNATIFVDENDSVTVKTTGSRKSLGYAVK